MTLVLVLALLPLDLNAGGAQPDSGGLSVRLELLPIAGASKYRITHTFAGKAPKRFVTGATDKNCQDPVDVMVVDDAVLALRSSLPCGGFAFTSSRIVNPGETWTIEGTAMTPAKAQRVIARYCPTAELLRAVAPEEKKASTPAWWFGCVDSAPVIVAGAGSPDEAWTRLLAAMRAGDLATVARLTTAGGIASLQRGVRGETETVAYARWGAGWAKWPPRYRLRSADRAEAWMGPEVKEHGLAFVRGADGWQLERWSPGE